MSSDRVADSETFRLRMQRGEAARALLLGSIYAALILTSVIRRAVSDTVMHERGVFLALNAIAAAGLAYELATWLGLRAACREARLLSRWRLEVSTATGVLVPSALLIGAVVLSPLEGYSALSAPVLLLLPLVTLLSVLRLRPRVTLFTGLAGAALHVLLVGELVRTGRVDHSLVPMLLMYGLGLGVIGTAGTVVTRAARDYVREAVEEARLRETTAARLAGIERDLEVARQIQKGLLPDASPELPGFELAGLNRPAEQTGGDYYDWQALPDGRVAVVMADVTGHGIGPALVMAVCRAYARATAPLDPDPASLLGRLNVLLSADVKGARFVTLALAVLDADGTVELVSAGHGPTFLYRAATGQVEQFGGDGLPLAVLPEETYGPSRRLAMREGDVLVMLTDGLVEWQDPQNSQFGADRLAAEIARHAGRPAAELLGAIDQAVKDFAAGSPQNDDVTAVCIRRTAV